jgi:hypothetical protein
MYRFPSKIIGDSIMKKILYIVAICSLSGEYSVCIGRPDFSGLEKSVAQNDESLSSLKAEVARLRAELQEARQTIEEQKRYIAGLLQHIEEQKAYYSRSSKPRADVSSATPPAKKQEKKGWSPEKPWEDPIVKNSYSPGVRVPQSNLVGESNPQSGYYH